MLNKIKDTTIATIGSHSALQILHGAQQEGFPTMAICQKGREIPYTSFKVADTIISLDKFSDFPTAEKQLKESNSIIIPHGSFVAYMGLDYIEKMPINYFGNRNVLKWESNRHLERQWLTKAGINMPKTFDSVDAVDTAVMVKCDGAAGGAGYFLSDNSKDINRQINAAGWDTFHMQEYVVGIPIYIHYFYSPLTGELEVMGMDRRYETNVDALGRISFSDQQKVSSETSYVVAGNFPIVVRESLLPEIFSMGMNVVKASKKLISPKGLFGPFCLETILTPDLKFSVFEISARIVAGTNPYVPTSPYAALRYKEPMSTGRRIAREIKNALETDELDKILG